MSAARPESVWNGAVVLAPQALGLGALAGAPAAAAASASLAPPPASGPAPKPPEPRPAPKAVRLPSWSVAAEGIYEGLLWAVRGLEECGRAFTRLAGRLGKVEARVAALEETATARPHGLAAVEARLRRLEEAAPGGVAAATPPAAPVRPDPDLVTLRRELATARVRIARLEGGQRQAGRPVADVEAHVTSLEHDLVGVYRELDGVAQRVDDRVAAATRGLSRVAELEAALAELAARVDRLTALSRLAPPVPARSTPAPAGAAAGPLSTAGPLPTAAPAAVPAASLPAGAGLAAARGWAGSDLARPALELTPDEVRARAASVLSTELQRIRSALGALGADPGP